MQIKRYVTSIFLLLAFVVFPVNVQAQTIDRILVIVNDEIVTESDLARVLYPIVARMRATLSGDVLNQKVNEARTQFLKQLVDDRLIVSAARELNIQIEESEIDELVDDMRDKFPSNEIFEKAIQDQGLTFKKIRERFKDDILKRRIIDYKVRSRSTVSPSEIRNYYIDNPYEFQSKPEVRVSQILIRSGGSRSPEMAKEKIDEIYQRLLSGEDIEVLAREYSEGAEASKGGDMGWVAEGQMIDRINDLIFSKNVGEVTEPIKTQLGYHVFKVVDQKASINRSFEEVREEIESVIYRNKSNKLLTEWLEELRDNAFIKYQG